MITDSMLAAAIDAMPNDFDSHDVIIKIAHDNQREYIVALHEKVSTNVNAPFQALHGSLGTRIKHRCDAEGFQFTPPSDHQSSDIFGQLSHCAAYRKVI